MKIGSDEHKRRFCDQFIASHNRYDPETLAWPELDEAALARLRAIPFWPEVLYTERRAGAIVDAYAETIADPMVRDAVKLQGFEEARHANLLRLMVRRYRIAAEERPLEQIGPDLYRAFADFGYGECLDAFLGFGVFKIARRSGFLPEPMFAIFDTLMHEENRHIVFFINWMAWEQARRGCGMPWLRSVVAAGYYGRAIGRLLGTVRRGRRRMTAPIFRQPRRVFSSTGFRFADWSKSAAPSMPGGCQHSTASCCSPACCRGWPRWR